jgi:DNA-binding response OmpR family regulator
VRPSGGDPGTLLVVDDSPSKRYVLCSWLRRAGYTVIEAATGGQALAMVDAEPVDAVVLDVQLPDMTGFEVCEQIKAAPEHAATPVIHVSAAAVDVMDRTQGLSRGADAYLVEPIDPDELLATVHAVLRYYRARQQAERLAERLIKLARMAVELNTATSVRELLRTAVTGTADIFGTPAMICTESLEGRRICAVVDGPDGQPAIRGWTSESFEVPVGSSYHDEPASRWPQLDWPDTLSLRALGTRRRTDRPAVYVVVPAWATDDGAPVLTQIGQTVVSALEGVRAYAQEHQIASTLQHSLLPARLPSPPGYDLAVRYVPASDQAEIGGDFYELCELPGRLVVAVGDVAGHSLHAATVMAELRHATRAYLAEGHRPAGVLDRLNELLLRLIPDEMATLCLLDIEPGTGATRLANAGHPPPLLVVDGRARYLTHHTPLLGVPGPPATEATFAMEPGGVLVLFTDGLVERRGRSVDDGLALLAEAAATVDEDLERFCDRLLAEVGPPEPEDDIAIVALRRA